GARGIGEQMPAVAKADVVVLAPFVGMPEVKQRLRDRPAGARQNLPAELNPARRAARLDEIGAQRRAGLEIRPFGLPHGRLIAVAALPPPCKRLRERIIECKSGRGERAQHSAARGVKRYDGLLACEPVPSCNPTRNRMAADITSASARGVHPLDCAPLTPCSMSSTARVAIA